MVRESNLNTIEYVPEQLPSDLKELVRVLQQELSKIQTSIRGLADGHIDVTYVEPKKPRIGDFKYADGVKWNPGSGEGFYYFKASTNTWTFWG